MGLRQVWKNFAKAVNPEDPPILEDFSDIVTFVKSLKDKCTKENSLDKLPEKLYTLMGDDAKQVVKELHGYFNDDPKLLKNIKLSKEIEKHGNTPELKGLFKDLKLRDHQNLGEVGEHFFSWNKNWGLGRKIVGFLMVHAPEYPTYFIPAYTQAKATGDAGDLKKGEGGRGIITGCMEGIAVGAIVSGKGLKGKEMIPYMICGAGLQYFSSKVFPVLGEKVGQQFYKRKGGRLAEETKLDIVSPTTTKTFAIAQPIEFKKIEAQLNSGNGNLPKNTSTGLKI